MNRHQALALLELSESMAEDGMPAPPSFLRRLNDAFRYVAEHSDAGRKSRVRRDIVTVVAGQERDKNGTRVGQKRDKNGTRVGQKREVVPVSSGSCVPAGRGVGGMGVVAVEEGTEKNNYALQKEQQQEAPSLDDLSLIDSGDAGDTGMSMVVHHGTVKAAAFRDAVDAKVARVQKMNQKKQLRSALAFDVFCYWKMTYEKPRSLLDAKREKAIIKALDENDGDVSELLYAIDGARKDDFVMGRNGGPLYDDVASILGDRSRVERHAGRMYDYRNGVPHPVAASAIDKLAETATQLAGVA